MQPTVARGANNVSINDSHFGQASGALAGRMIEFQARLSFQPKLQTVGARYTVPRHSFPANLQEASPCAVPVCEPLRSVC